MKIFLVHIPHPTPNEYPMDPTDIAKDYYGEKDYYTLNIPS
jgi:hypothetical protein